ncbi:MAG: glucose-1-phosphate thymidylyltransferase RfbA [Anaerolineaceae bacterium]|nr:glucose-1-phosphate thymidylyltransferase RfbA [Anaerolineaceae bacterium]
MKGIILAGGHGTRLRPLTTALSKQLLPVYNKPMIFYPLSMLLLADIREILVISSPSQLPLFQRLLGTGKQWGVKFSFIAQKEPKGIAEAFLLGEEFIDNQPVCLILGDNIFYGNNIPQLLRNAAGKNDGAHIFAYEVNQPEQYGIVEVDGLWNPIRIVEKPRVPKSSWAVPGLYFYDSNVTVLTKSLKPSPRGELEITDLNRLYLQAGKLSVSPLGRGVAWLDAGTSENLLQASQFVHAVEARQGTMISCIEEIAYKRGFISISALKILVAKMGDNQYKAYLEKLIEKENHG